MAYTAIILPFRSIIFHKLVSFYVSSEASYWAIVDTVIDVLFWIDLLVSMCSAYYDEEGKLVKSRKIVIVKYIKGWFLLDLFSCLPISYIINE
jgi:hyperpolarization activated cyclic nucleotide-gated potassium channel 1